MMFVVTLLDVAGKEVFALVVVVVVVDVYVV